MIARPRPRGPYHRGIARPLVRIDGCRCARTLYCRLRCLPLFTSRLPADSRLRSGPANEPTLTRSSTTTSALRLQRRRQGLFCPNCWRKYLPGERLPSPSWRILRLDSIPGERREAGRGCYSPRKSLAMAGSGCAVLQAHPHTSMTGARLPIKAGKAGVHGAPRKARSPSGPSVIHLRT